jgi:hypothetical protein
VNVRSVRREVAHGGLMRGRNCVRAARDSVAIACADPLPFNARVDCMLLNAKQRGAQVKAAGVR